MSSYFVEGKKTKKYAKKRRWVGGGTGLTESEGGVREILARFYQDWSRLYVCRRMMGEAGFMVGTRLPSITPES